MDATPRPLGQKKVLYLASRVALYGWVQPAPQDGECCVSTPAIRVLNLNLEDIFVTRLAVWWLSPVRGPLGAELGLNRQLGLGESMTLIDVVRLDRFLQNAADLSATLASLDGADRLPIMLSVDVFTPGESCRLSIGLRLRWAAGLPPEFLIDPELPAPTTTLLDG